MPTHDPDAAQTTAFRRSMRASRARRRAAALRRRRILRGRGTLIAAAGLMAFSGAGAVAHERTGGGKKAVKAQSGGSIVAAQKALGISADGVAGPQTRRAVKRFQRKNGLTVDGVIGPQTLAALGVAGDGGSGGSKGDDDGGGEQQTSAPSGHLESIAQCESGGDPTAVSPGGKYRGKYQFSRETWKDMGGSGDPADAPEAEQDQRAAELLESRGPRSWPNCA